MLFAISLLSTTLSRGEALLQLFNVNWAELAEKMPEIAEAGYTSLWLPPPAKAGSVYSVGYDIFDAFDLGDKNQRGTVRTKYGTKEELIRAVEMAHRFGLRVYFDNITNHRGFDVPAYNSNTPTNVYPGLSPGDFHLQSVSGGYYRNWGSISDWSSIWDIQNYSLSGLIDLATEPGNLNVNFGPNPGGTIQKPVYVRQPGSNSLYMDQALPGIGGPWHPFAGTNGDPVPEDVNAFLIRAVLWTLNETKCDGFRLDAVKHVPSGFFGDTTDSPNGYTGAIQAMFDYVHGYGPNVTTNGYTETGGNRDSVFDTERTRNDAMLFGEHLGEPPSFQEYLSRGMRLLNAPYHSALNNILGNPSASLSGLDQRDYRPYSSAFTGPQSVLFAQSHDDAYSSRRELQDAYNFTREGLPLIYSDGYNQSTAAPGEEPFPRVPSAPYLGQFGDPRMPDLAWLHQQFARGGTRPRWSDADVVAYERYDYRDVDQSTAFNNANATVLLFAMNDNYATAISFDDGIAQTTEGTFYECFPVSATRGRGLAVGFPPGSVLFQMADASGKDQACSKLLVRQATSSLAEAQATANDPNPVNRKVYVGSQSVLAGGGAIEFKIPAGSYVLYGYQPPQPSRVNVWTNAITFLQGGSRVPSITVYRKDGTNGDPSFNPLYPARVRGSIDPAGNPVGTVNVSNRTYAIQVPVLTNAPFDIIVRSDASVSNVLVKLDGGIDLNSQMSLGPLTGDRRDNKPGFATDLYLGYEQAAFQFRYGPEKFGAGLIERDSFTSPDAETWVYQPGGTNGVVQGSGTAASGSSTAAWVYHDPSAPATLTAPSAVASQRLPLAPLPGQHVSVYVKVGYKLQVDKGYIYYTTDGSSPEGAFGQGRGSTKITEAHWAGSDSTDPNIDWWMAEIRAADNSYGATVRYKVGFFNSAVSPMSDVDGAKRFGMGQAAVTNFNPTTAAVWLNNDLKASDTRVGLQTGFHGVRAKAFLPREGKSQVFNTFMETFFYAGPPSAGVIAYPPQDGASLTSTIYTVVIRADDNTVGVEYTIEESSGASRSGIASQVSPDPSISSRYPAYPREYRFTYTPIPASGTATFRVRLKDLATSVYTNRYGTAERTVTTAAPLSMLNITAPASDGLVLLDTNATYTLQACYSASLGYAATNFSLLINGELQPRSAYIFRLDGCTSGLRSVYFNWNTSIPGTNIVQWTYTNGAVVLSDTRTIAVARPGDSDGDGMSDAAELIAGTDPFDPRSLLKITGLDASSNRRLIVWDSVPGMRYEVHATPDVTLPMTNISGTIPSAGETTFWLDQTPEAARHFYRVRVLDR